MEYCPKNYCPDCAWQHGKVNVLPEGKLFDTPYQEIKIRKHTQANSSCSFQSVFTDSSTGLIREHTFSAVNSGSLLIDKQDRINLVFPVGEVIGAFYEYGVKTGEADMAFVVQHDNPNKIHTFLDASSNYTGRTCTACGKPFLANM